MRHHIANTSNGASNPGATTRTTSICQFTRALEGNDPWPARNSKTRLQMSRASPCERDPYLSSFSMSSKSNGLDLRIGCCFGLAPYTSIKSRSWMTASVELARIEMVLLSRGQQGIPRNRLDEAKRACLASPMLSKWPWVTSMTSHASTWSAVKATFHQIRYLPAVRQEPERRGSCSEDSGSTVHTCRRESVHGATLALEELHPDGPDRPPVPRSARRRAGQRRVLRFGGTAAGDAFADTWQLRSTEAGPQAYGRITGCTERRRR